MLGNLKYLWVLGRHHVHLPSALVSPAGGCERWCQRHQTNLTILILKINDQNMAQRFQTLRMVPHKVKQKNNGFSPVNQTGFIFIRTILCALN